MSSDDKDLEARVRSLEVDNSKIMARLDFIAELLQAHVYSEENYLRMAIFTLLAGMGGLVILFIQTIVK
jgi:hypothetical protein